MKKILIEAHGGTDTLRAVEAPSPTPGPGEILVRNAAVGLNFIDIYQRTGLYPVALPATLGTEGAGEVAAVGEGVETLRAGDRVAYIAAGGAYAEESVVPAGMAAKLPACVSYETAAAAFLKGLTAEMLVRQVYKLQRGEAALVHAAAGGVGTLLCQWAAHIGAAVVAVVGDASKAEIARAAGAAYIIVRSRTDNIAAAARAATGGRGVAVVYDSVGAATFYASLDSLAPRGMMVSYGNASGPAPAFAPGELARRGSLFLTRPSLFHYATPGRLQPMAETLFTLIEQGVLRPAAPTLFPLDKVADAHELLESGKSTGSIVLTV